ncbi:IclR family transcriptional regulator [Actomonas aquatica]|uniref:IclR family transcriptional regulator n=1 Tax=Actomonas aquatica TaxID=2866162 RepID=A0ABZ1CEJ8_9BACT|nr:IclR family transcriptional regulator [Opitutus sp. WL0086]WRQ90089.1 IclR family transcriptional regulator [Opitutus sp. WL0086]
MSIAVLDRAFSILEVMARSGRPLSLAELAEESRLPKPTVHRILHSLRELGYLEPGIARGSFILSERLSSLREHGRDAALRTKVNPAMERLRDAFDETVNLGLLEGVYVRYAHVVETDQALRWIVKPGARDLFYTTALGRAIVAHLPEERQARLVAKVCADMPARGRSAARKRLEAELEATRERGYALEEEETVEGVACMAISLAAHAEPLAGISVAVPVTRFPAKRRQALSSALCQTATAADLAEGGARA